MKALIDEDMIFRVEVKSSMRKISKPAIWEYSKLKLFYHLEECGL